MKIISLLICCSFLLEISTTRLFAQSNLETVKNQFVSDPALANASIGFCVVDLKSGEKLAQHQSNVSLPPASTTKLFATASAIEMLGESYQPKTRIYVSSEIGANGTVKGDLWIRGGGDASLGSKYYNADGKESDFLKKWADTLYKMGLRKVEGSVIGDGSEFGYKGAPEGWTWNDMGNYYGAGPAGLPIFDNMLRYYFKVNNVAGSVPELLKTFPIIEGFHFNNYISASKASGDNSYIYGAPFSLDRFGTGYLQMNSSITVKGSLPDPELQFAEELKKALIERGIAVTAASKSVRNMEELAVAWKRYATGHTLVYTHAGPSVASIAYWTNLKSVNLFAEQLVCNIGYSKNGDGSTENGLKQMNKYWDSRIPTSGLYLKDGSGLSRSNAISAEHFCALLKYMHGSANAKAYKATLAIAGETGTLSDVCKGQAAQGKIKAKSGTMSRIKSYAGYVQTNSGKELAFSIIVNNYNCSNDALLSKIEKLMNAMVVI